VLAVAGAAGIATLGVAIPARAEGAAAAHGSQAASASSLVDHPLFLSMGFVGTVPLAGQRGTQGFEVTLVRWTDDDPGLALAVFAQGEYVNGYAGRFAVGPQVTWGTWGLELGYAYQSAFGPDHDVHGAQLTPFLSLGIAYVGLRTFTPIAPRPELPSTSVVIGAKIPMNLGHEVRRHRFCLVPCD
jgi:hypothetical protein